MSRWITPITDRTPADLSARTSKAFFNISDWIRIYGNSLQVHDAAKVLLTLDMPFTEMLEPAITDFPSAADINSLVENIDVLREVVSVSGLVELRHNFTDIGDGISPDYLDVNAWELDLLLMYDGINGLAGEKIYCGVATAGQPHFWQARFHSFTFVLPAGSPTRRPRAGMVSTGTGMTRQNGFRHYA